MPKNARVLEGAKEIRIPAAVRWYAIACLAATSVAVCDGRGQAAQRFDSLYQEELQGKWKGEKDGTTATLSFRGKDAAWKVEQRTGKKKESISAGPMECVFVSKAGWVDLMLPVPEKNSNGEKTGKTESLHLGRLHPERDGTIRLKIYPVRRYRPVEDMILRRVPSAKSPVPTK